MSNMENQLGEIRQLLEEKKNCENLRKFEKRIADVTGDHNFNLKELSPELLNIIRRYLYVASASWESKLTENYSMMIKKSQKDEKSNKKKKNSDSKPQPDNTTPFMQGFNLVTNNFQGLSKDGKRKNNRSKKNKDTDQMDDFFNGKRNYSKHNSMELMPNFFIEPVKESSCKDVNDSRAFIPLEGRKKQDDKYSYQLNPKQTQEYIKKQLIVNAQEELIFTNKGSYAEHGFRIISPLKEEFMGFQHQKIAKNYKEKLPIIEKNKLKKQMERLEREAREFRDSCELREIRESSKERENQEEVDKFDNFIFCFTNKKSESPFTTKNNLRAYNYQNQRKKGKFLYANNNQSYDSTSPGMQIMEHLKLQRQLQIQEFNKTGQNFSLRPLKQSSECVIPYNYPFISQQLIPVKLQQNGKPSHPKLVQETQGSESERHEKLTSRDNPNCDSNFQIAPILHKEEDDIIEDGTEIMRAVVVENINYIPEKSPKAEKAETKSTTQTDRLPLINGDPPKKPKREYQVKRIKQEDKTIIALGSSFPIFQSSDLIKKIPQDKQFNVRYSHMRDYYSLVNYSNNLFVQTPPVSSNYLIYKAYVGRGNNDMLIRMIIKSRWWWQIVNQKEDQHVNLMWTQGIKKNFVDNLRSLKKSPYDHYNETPQRKSLWQSDKEDNDSDTTSCISNICASSIIVNSSSIKSPQQQIKRSNSLPKDNKPAKPDFRVTYKKQIG